MITIKEKLELIDNMLLLFHRNKLTLSKLYEMNETGDHDLEELFNKLYKDFLDVWHQCDNLFDETKLVPNNNI